MPITELEEEHYPSPAKEIINPWTKNIDIIAVDSDSVKGTSKQ